MLALFYFYLVVCAHGECDLKKFPVPMFQAECNATGSAFKAVGSYRTATVAGFLCVPNGELAQEARTN